MVALIDFEARHVGELTFKKGDHLEILNETEEGWWLARHKKTKLEGFIPAKLQDQNGKIIPVVKK